MMDMQAAPPTYAEMDTGRPPMGNPPMLGQQVPGFSGGLPSQGGLSVLANPMAQELQSQYAEGGAVRQAENVRQMGRGEDSVLMHVTPHELSGLQALAMAHGGSLTINPQTGLPEAGFLGGVFKKLLPTLIGVGMNFVLPGSGLVATLGGKAATAGLMTGLGSLALTGSLKKGLMAGLGAYGGASLAGGIQGAVKGVPVPGAPPAAPVMTNPATGAINSMNNMVTSAGITPAATNAVSNVALQGAPSIAGTAAQQAGRSLLAPVAGGLETGVGSLGGAIAQSAPQSLIVDAGLKKGLGGFAQGFANTAKGNMKGLLAKAAVPMAISGAVQGVSGAFAPSGGVATPTGQIDNSYQGPYYAQDRQQIMDPEGPVSGKQRRHFAVSMPEIRNMAGQITQPGSMTARGTPILQMVPNPKAKKGENMYTPQFVPFMGGPEPTNEQDMGYARGGEIAMANGAFVLDARTVSEIGNGSSSAGIEILRRLGGRPVKGRGDGVSDSVPARIGKRQPARVARDEVVIPAKAVKRIGQGNPKRGAAKLYALMDKAHKARKNAKRGQDTKLRRGLAL